MPGHAPGPGPASRKRARSPDAEPGRGNPAHRPGKYARGADEPCGRPVKHALLAQYYSDAQTLRQYALSKLPASSRIRRRKIASVGCAKTPPEKAATEDELAVGELLDSTIVARRRHAEAVTETEAGHDHRWEQWLGFSQKGDESNVTLSDGLKGSIYSQSEVSHVCR